jgi:phosphatidate cytidylyltransferase
MLGKRLLAATFMISALAGVLWLDLRVFQDSLMLHLVFLIVACVSFTEFWKLCRATGHQTFSVWGTISGCGLVAVHYWAMSLSSSKMVTVNDLHRASDLQTGALAVAILGAFLFTAWRHQFEASLGGVAVTCLGLLYIFFLPSFVLKLRHMGENGQIGGPNWNVFGHKMVVATIILAKGCDSWAYLFGRKLGRHKAVPSLSPGKTLEGFAAGLVGSILMSLFLWWEPIGMLTSFGPWRSCIIGFCIALAAILGDLSESLLKRSAGAKDAGEIVPGYGGAMDVIDSLMVAGPVAYFLIPAMIPR